MFCQALNEQSAIEAVVDDSVEQHHHIRHLVLKSEVNHSEIVLGVEHVKVFYNLLIGDVSLTERCRLIKYREGIAHAAIGFLSYHGKCFLLIFYSFLVGYRLQVSNGVLHRHTLKVIDLTTTKDGRKNLMLLCRGKDKYHMCRWLLKRL